MLSQDNNNLVQKQTCYNPPPKSRKAPRGESSHLAKLTWEKVREIRRLHSMGVPPTRLAKDFDVTRQTIRQIVHNYTWREE